MLYSSMVFTMIFVCLAKTTPVFVWTVRLISGSTMLMAVASFVQIAGIKLIPEHK